MATYDTAASKAAEFVSELTTALTLSPLQWLTSKAPGTITNVGSAVLQSLNPCPGDACSYSLWNKFPGILGASGMTLAPWLGKAGTILHTGGGHNDYGGNEVVAFDLAAQQWAMLSQPNPRLYSVPIIIDPANPDVEVDANGNPVPKWKTFHSDGTNGENWVDGDFASYAVMDAKPTQQDQPGSHHSYGNLVALPPGFGNNDPLGALLTPVRAALGPGDGWGAKRSHIFPLSTRKWSRFSANVMPDTVNFSHSFVDLGRRRVVTHSGNGLCALDVDTKQWSKLPLSPLPPHTIYMVWGHWVEADLYVGTSPFLYGYGPHVWIVDPKTNAFTKPNLAAPWPNDLSWGGGDWSERLRGVAYYHGRGESFFVLVRPPVSGDPRTTPWDTQTINFTGAAPALNDVIGAGAHCKRFIPHDAAGGFLWLGQTSAPVQFWKV